MEIMRFPTLLLDFKPKKKSKSRSLWCITSTLVRERKLDLSYRWMDKMEISASVVATLVLGEVHTRLAIFVLKSY